MLSSERNTIFIRSVRPCSPALKVFPFKILTLGGDHTINDQAEITGIAAAPVAYQLVSVLALDNGA
ncbi:hypothetical protein QMK17_05835 [Rhodococcus sp. G-MC3]|uniref:hypothetical protein n=1 Tax=Rhodococcus sp. G-MC3 TaxID=3046209 RepID=UPI0024BADC28|nr:hypothetical protein [Rhodococcus sp. G-MC3]MDJ0392848.1 hypothetical protein [Rhodococcus sp. G-MC3]